MKKATAKSYALRIDGPLVKPLQELKKQNRRSLNAEINAALEAWVAGAHAEHATPASGSSSKSAEDLQTEAATQPPARKRSKRKSADSADPTPEPAIAPDATAPLP
jgi:hypothetical protein